MQCKFDVVRRVMRAHPTFQEVLAAELEKCSRRAATARVTGPVDVCFDAADRVPWHPRTSVERTYVELESGARAHEPELPSGETLVLPDGLDEAGLRRLRRQLARRFHPDCLPSAGAEAATRKMSQINHLIDEALASKRTSQQ